MQAGGRRDEAEATLEKVRALMLDFGTAYFKKVVQFNPLVDEAAGASAAAEAEVMDAETRRYAGARYRLAGSG